MPVPEFVPDVDVAAVSVAVVVEVVRVSGDVVDGGGEVIVVVDVTDVDVGGGWVDVAVVDVAGVVIDVDPGSVDVSAG